MRGGGLSPGLPVVLVGQGAGDVPPSSAHRPPAGRSTKVKGSLLPVPSRQGPAGDGCALLHGGRRRGVGSVPAPGSPSSAGQSRAGGCTL